MSRPLTMGSLFSGIGGFELAGTLCGIKPVWASEVLPFPIRVTTKRFPDMVHLGDINHINGAKIPPVDIITGGFCCQDLSAANGKRVGLHGERSGLFFEMIRIIKEMREATGQRFPAYGIFENVMGIFSSNAGFDFQEVLNEIVKIKNESLSVPMPPDGKWLGAGEIVADNFSVAYRCYDASAWGTAQRRRRCFIVVDFNGGNAGKIQFDETRLRGNPPQGGFPWESLAGNPAVGVGVSGVEWEVDRDDHGAVSGVVADGKDVWPEVARTIIARADSSPCVDRGQPFVATRSSLVYDARGNGDGVTVNTLTGDHENRVTDYTAIVLDGIPTAAAFMGGQGADARSIVYSEEVVPTLRSQAGGNTVPMVMTAFGICSQGSNSMKSDNPNSGIYEAGTARTIDRNGGSPLCNQGGLCVVSIQGAIMGCEENLITLQACDYKDALSIARPQYIVRRLLPQECALLQGAPSDWCANLKTPEPTEEDIAFWSEVFETHRKIAGKSSKPKSRKQIIKWLQNPHSDSAEYMAWGNSIAVPCAVFILGGIVWVESQPSTENTPA